MKTKSRQIVERCFVVVIATSLLLACGEPTTNTADAAPEAASDATHCAVWSVSTTPENVALNGVWASGPSDAWAVGSMGGGAPTHPLNGSILHWNGSVWSVSNSDADFNSFSGVWGSGKGDVWAVGNIDLNDVNYGIVHWDGSAWSLSASDIKATIRGIGGSGPNDVWVVGGDPSRPNRFVRASISMILHWNGSGWLALPSPLDTPLNGVWSSGPSDAWAVGGGTILHWDGSVWSTSLSTTNSSFNAVGGSSANDVWVVGANDTGGLILHWDGSAWSPFTTKYGLPELLAVWSSGESDAWAVGYYSIAHWNGEAWLSYVETTCNNWGSDIWGSGPNDLWIVQGGDGPENLLHQ